MIHKKKTWPECFQKIVEGEKTFDLRLADWECKPGDILLLQEWDPEKKEYTGREIEKKITYVGKTNDYVFFSREDIEKYGYQIIAFR